MTSKLMASASPFIIFVSLIWLVAAGVAAWKWDKPLYRLPPFFVATLEPIILEWENIVVGIITMNIVTALFIGALRLEELWSKKRP